MRITTLHPTLLDFATRHYPPTHPGAVYGHVVRHARAAGGLAHTFVHAMIASVAWHGVAELFRRGHGLGMVLFVIVVVAVAVHLLRRRRRRSW